MLLYVQCGPWAGCVHIQGLEEALLQEGIQMASSQGTPLSSSSSTNSAQQGPVFDNGTALTSSQVTHKTKQLVQKIKRRLKLQAPAFAAKEEKYALPVDMNELVEDLLHTAMHARGRPDKELQLLVAVSCCSVLAKVALRKAAAPAAPALSAALDSIKEQPPLHPEQESHIHTMM